MTKNVDRTAEITLTSGTGTLTLAGPVVGHSSFLQALGAVSVDIHYCIAHLASGGFEVGIGRFISSSNTMQRTLVLSSSNGDSKVVFPTGEKVVYVTQPAEATTRATSRRGTDPALEVRAAGGQSVPIMEVFDSAGLPCFRINSQGKIDLPLLGGSNNNSVTPGPVNGRFEKLPSGTMICRAGLAVGNRTSFGSGTFNDPYRTNTFNWTYVEPFDITPVVTLTHSVLGGSAAQCWGSVGYEDSTATGVFGIQVIFVGNATGNLAVGVNAVAIGRYV